MLLECIDAGFGEDCEWYCVFRNPDNREIICTSKGCVGKGSLVQDGLTCDAVSGGPGVLGVLGGLGGLGGRGVLGGLGGRGVLGGLREVFGGRAQKCGVVVVVVLLTSHLIIR